MIGDSNENAKLIDPWAFSFLLSIVEAQAESPNTFRMVSTEHVCSSVSGFWLAARWWFPDDYGRKVSWGTITECWN